jgi:hypothetical protein
MILHFVLGVLYLDIFPTFIAKDQKDQKDQKEINVKNVN